MGSSPQAPAAPRPDYLPNSAPSIPPPMVDAPNPNFNPNSYFSNQFPSNFFAPQNPQPNAQQGALMGIPNLAQTAQPNMTAGSTYPIPSLAGNQNSFDAQGQQMNPLTSAVAAILSGQR